MKSVFCECFRSSTLRNSLLFFFEYHSFFRNFTARIVAFFNICFTLCGPKTSHTYLTGLLVSNVECKLACSERVSFPSAYLFPMPFFYSNRKRSKTFHCSLLPIDCGYHYQLFKSEISWNIQNRRKVRLWFLLPCETVAFTSF